MFRSTPIACLAALLLAISAEVRPTFAEAEQSGADKSVGQSSASDAGQSGAKLKWLPPRPEATEADSSVTAARYTTPSLPRRALRTARGARAASDPLSEPFGDKKTACAMAPAPVKANKNGSKQPPLAGTLEDTIAPRQHELKATCPSPKDLKRIADIGTNIVPSDGDLPRDCPLGDDVFQPRSFAPITYTWTASALCHKPLYFEDVQLERYGHMAGPWLQPFASGVNFFLTIPILPYKMGLELPNECMYTLGYYRPGDCAPYLFDPLPLSVRGAFFEAGAWAGAIYAFP
jgi:hypothetical protein